MKIKYLNHSGLFLLASVCSALCIGRPAMAASPVGDVVGKVTVGYQGWFSCAGDGSPLNSWGHDNLETWPDVREFTTTFSGCPFWQNGVQQAGYTGNLGNGQPAKMFSSDNQQVANTHCLWMQQNGIDTIALQRFGSYTSAGNTKNFHDAVDLKMMNGAQTYGRKFFIMYDCTATDPVVNDWNNTIVAAQHLTSSSAYAKQNGKPVVCLWGVGKSGRGATADWVNTINAFKNMGCYVIGGPLAGFASDTANFPAYNACNMIMAWEVGKTSATDFQSLYANDLAYCNAHGLDYQACTYPGTAFYNSNGGNVSPKNQIPRMHGDFMWKQFAGAKLAGVQSLYVAMFDEANEATSIFKCAEDSSMIPAGKYFLTLDADGVHVSSDFYLRLVNDGGKMIKGITGYQATEPTPFVVSGLANGTYKLIVRHSGLALDVDHQSTTNGSPVEQWTYNGGNNQRWNITSLGGTIYSIVGVQSGRTLEVPGSSTANGTLLDIWDSNNGANQKWNITPTDSGYYSVINVNSGLAMEVFGGVGATTNGAAVDQWHYGSGFNQQWSFQAP